VAEAVDRTPPSIYLHFATKDELIHAVCERSFDLLTDAFRVAIEGIDDPVDRIRAMSRAYVGFALEHPEQYRILFMSSAPDDVTDLDGLRLTDCFGMLAAAVEECLATGRFVPGDVILISLALWATVHGAASLRIAHDHLAWPPLDDQLDQLVEQNLRGLLATGSPDRA
jgi:AcrR family transcriptional regulator